MYITYICEVTSITCTNNTIKNVILLRDVYEDCLLNRSYLFQGKDLYMDLDSENLTLIDPQDMTVLNVQPIQSIRVWGVGRDNGR